ncbi:MAG TPA: Bro-N domain-containing protein [Puia sp.]|nr:Bro-N domain-containing protein [Puia sp.]
MNNIKLFGSKKVRSAWNEQEQKWYFSIVDVVAVLTESVDSSAYWRKLKERLKKEGNETVTNCHGLKMEAPDGKMRLTDIANTEQLLRLIQSIPSPKAEPFKLWLSQVGYERIQEIENPELAQTRMRELYKAKGYSEEWIEKRIRGVAIRDELTGEWKKRGVKEGKEYSILTAEISKATFGLTPAAYAQGFVQNKKAANEGGNVAGRARKDLESKSGKKVISKENYKEVPESKVRRLKKG